MKLNNMSKMRKISLGIMIPFSLIFTSSMVLYTSCSRTSDNKKVVPEELLTFSADNTTVTGHEDISAYNTLIIPKKHNEVDITSIGSSAFQDCSFTSLSLPNSLNSIGNYAFQRCFSLTSVNLSDSLTSVGEGAFRDCASLTSLYLPNSLTSIGLSAFSYCSSLASITLNSLNSIGNYAFLDCSSLTSLSLPNSLTSIGEGAFESCSSINSIVASYNETPIIGSNAFLNVASSGTVKNTGIVLSNNFLIFLQGYGIPNDGSWTVAP